MSDYVSVEFANNYPGLGDPPVTAEEIAVASQDLDDLVLADHGRSRVAPFRRVDKSRLDPAQRYDLERATCEQILHRRTLGAEFFRRQQRKGRVTFEGTSHERTLPHISSRALTILTRAGLTRRGGRPVPSSDPFRGGLYDETLYDWHKP